MSTQLSEDTSIPVPLPHVARFEKLGYGMFIHWGLYSQLGQGEWIMDRGNIPLEEYSKLKDTFTAEDFDGRAIARLAREAGMRYITLTTRHHDGFSLYDTRGMNDYDAPHSPAGRDLVAEFIEGCRSEDILPVLYHTTLDWYHPEFNGDFPAYLQYLRDSVEILCSQYGPIGGLWFDGNWSREDVDWEEDALYSVIRKHQPEAMIVNNTGMAKRGEVGHPEIDSLTFEQGRPAPLDRRGMSKYVATEMCQTLNRHWGIAKDDLCYMSPRDLIENIAACRKVGANYLLNVGPTATGAIPEYETACLRRVGSWFDRHEVALREAKPRKSKCDHANDFLLEHEDGRVFFFAHNIGIESEFADDDHVVLTGSRLGLAGTMGISRKVKSVRWMDNGQELPFSQNLESGMFSFHAIGHNYGANQVVRVAEISFE